MDLLEWLVVHVRHKDVLTKKLQGFEVKENEVIFTYKDKTVVGIVQETLTPVDAKEHTIIAIPHTDENVDILVKNWKKFLQPKLTIIFANTKLNQHWGIKPTAHAIIAGDEIEQGIRAMAGNVPTV